jgi:1-pyrroline-5-carboxylate dehydrogenase
LEENEDKSYFTNSNLTFNTLWKQVSENLSLYKTYPKIVGETGNKDFIFAHNSANPLALATTISSGSFEYQGQKCSAASRAYIPKSIWDETCQHILKMISEIKIGDVMDCNNFVNAVIDEASFDKIMVYINDAKTSKDVKIIAGGNGDKSKGYFIEPMVIVTENPHYVTMQEEIFAPGF